MYVYYIFYRWQTVRESVQKKSHIYRKFLPYLLFTLIKHEPLKQANYCSELTHWRDSILKTVRTHTHTDTHCEHTVHCDHRL